MKFPIQVTFRNMERSGSVEEKTLQLAQKLDRYYQGIISCHIVIEGDHRHHYKGKLYHVRIDLALPGTELVYSRTPSEKHAHEDVYVAIRDAFNGIKKQMQTYISKLRGNVKHHDNPPQGTIAEIYPPADYGYIETMDGRRIRFTSASVVAFDFEKLEVGDVVRFTEAENSLNPGASTIYVERRSA